MNTSNESIPLSLENKKKDLPKLKKIKKTLKKCICICKCCVCPRLKSLECCTSCDVRLRNKMKNTI